MQEYWCVETRYNDKGHVFATVSSTTSEKKPPDTMEELPLCDRYTNWFETKAEAHAYAADAKRA